MMQESASPLGTPLRGQTQTHAARMAAVPSQPPPPPPEPLLGTLQPEAMQELSRLLLLQAAEAAKGFAAEQELEPAPSGAEEQVDTDGATGERGRMAPPETLDLMITDESPIGTVSPSGGNGIGAPLCLPPPSKLPTPCVPPTQRARVVGELRRIRICVLATHAARSLCEVITGVLSVLANGV